MSGNFEKVKDLQAQVSSLMLQLAEAKAELGHASAEKKLSVEAAKFEMQLEMQSKIEAAYDKGYERCKDALEMNMKLMKQMQER